MWNCWLYDTFQLQTLYKNNIGLYRDDGLAIVNDTPRNIENIKKNICKIFDKYNLRVTIEANKKVVNFSRRKHW